MVRFVHHQNSSQAFLVATDSVAAQFEEEIALVLTRRGELEIAGNVLQELQWAEQGVEYIGKRNVRTIEDLQKATNQNRLARPHLSGENHKPFAALHSVIQRRQRLIVLPGRKQK